jgi:hypothetical protein
VICSVGVTFIIYLNFKTSSPSALASAARLSLVAVFLFIFMHIGCYLRFVKSVPIQTLNTDVFVTLGYERTEFALHTFPGATDVEMLKQRGLIEEEVARLWTFESIFVARSFLWIFYTGFVLSLMSVLSFGALEDASPKTVPNP